MTMDLASGKGETNPCLRDVSTGMLQQMFFNMSMLLLSLPYPPMLYVRVPGRLWFVANRHNQKRVSLLGSLPLIRFSTSQALKTLFSSVKGKGKSVPLQAWSGSEGSRKLKFPDFMTTVQDGGKFVSPTHRPPLPPGNTSGTHFC